MSARRPTRRAVLGGGAATLAAASLPGCAADDAVDSAAPREPAGIDHVLVVTMENRSFDHYLGALRLVEGREDVDGLTGQEVFPQVLAEGEGIRALRYAHAVVLVRDDGFHAWAWVNPGGVVEYPQSKLRFPAPIEGRLEETALVLSVAETELRVPLTSPSP